MLIAKLLVTTCCQSVVIITSQPGIAGWWLARSWRCPRIFFCFKETGPNFNSMVPVVVPPGGQAAVMGQRTAEGERTTRIERPRGTGASSRPLLPAPPSYHHDDSMHAVVPDTTHSPGCLEDISLLKYTDFYTDVNKLDLISCNIKRLHQAIV